MAEPFSSYIGVDFGGYYTISWGDFRHCSKFAHKKPRRVLRVCSSQAGSTVFTSSLVLMRQRSVL